MVLRTNGWNFVVLDVVFDVLDSGIERGFVIFRV